jgi:hypothetical protein
MTNKEIKGKVLKRLESVLGIKEPSKYINEPHPKIFGKISKRAVYHVAKGDFKNNYVGEFGMYKLKRFFEALENEKQNG